MRLRKSCKKKAVSLFSKESSIEWFLSRSLARFTSLFTSSLGITSINTCFIENDILLILLQLFLLSFFSISTLLGCFLLCVLRAQRVCMFVLYSFTCNLLLETHSMVLFYFIWKWIGIYFAKYLKKIIECNEIFLSYLGIYIQIQVIIYLKVNLDRVFICTIQPKKHKKNKYWPIKQSLYD